MAKGEIKIKTAQQIEVMREWWKILRSIHEELRDFLKPWISTWDIEKKAEEIFERLWPDFKPSFKWYGWFPCILCTSLNEVVVHWVPSKKDILKNWDILKIDCWLYYKWCHTDSCWSHFIWEVDPKVKHLSDVTKKAMMKWIKQVRPWVRVWDVENMIQRTIQQVWYCPIYDCTWHWVWEELHEAPEIMNYWKKWKWPMLKEWMCLAIEPMATLWKEKYTYNKNWDWWTLIARDSATCAQREHTVLVTKDWYEILT